MYRSLLANDMYAELDRLQREMSRAFEYSPSIRGGVRGGFPAMNVGGAPQSMEIYAFAPGIDPSTIEGQIEKGVLTIAGERPSSLPAGDSKASVHIDPAQKGDRFKICPRGARRLRRPPAGRGRLASGAAGSRSRRRSR